MASSLKTGNEVFLISNSAAEAVNRMSADLEKAKHILLRSSNFEESVKGLSRALKDMREQLPLSPVIDIVRKISADYQNVQNTSLPSQAVADAALRVSRDIRKTQRQLMSLSFSKDANLMFDQLEIVHRQLTVSPVMDVANQLSANVQNMLTEHSGKLSEAELLYASMDSHKWSFITKTLVEQLDHDEPVISPTEYTQEIESVLADVNQLDSDNKLAEYIQSLSSSTKVLFLWFALSALNYFMDVSKNVAANLVTPVIQEMIEESTSVTPARTIQNKISKLPKEFPDYDFSGLRFISGTGVRLRDEPSTKSMILDQPELGQVVSVLHKEKNWIQVEYWDDVAEELLQGWVHTRYTKRFRNYR